MKFAKLTDPDHNEVWIAPRLVTKVKLPVPGRYATGTNAVVVIGNLEQAVMEYPAAVVRILEEADDYE